MKPQHPRIQHTAEFSNRRRALFPCENTDTLDSDLGCISPLNLDSDAFTPAGCVGDYDIIGLVDKTTCIRTPTSGSLTSKIVALATTDESPTQQLKTPQDTSINTVFPKFIRSKTIIDTAVSIDYKHPKVRTALFPEVDMSVPSQTFYPKSTPEHSPHTFIAARKPTIKKTTAKNRSYLCNRKNKFRSGQINAGVAHKIKKNRKPKKISKTALLDVIKSNASPKNIPANASEPSQLGPLPRDPTPSPEPDPTKKFFKSTRPKGVVTMNGKIKLEMKKGRLSVISPKNKLKRPRTAEVVNAKRIKLGDDAEQSLDAKISNIISSLEDKENEQKISEPEVLMSPTSQMCNMTSGLALNSPKKARDLSAVLEAMPSANTEQAKLFPVFYPGKTTIPTKVEHVKTTSGTKKFRALAKDQMLLDAGQKRWGVTQCAECKIIYHMGDPGEEIAHFNYHNAVHIFRFNGWKNERLVSNDTIDGKIIQIVPGDSKIWWKKVRDVTEFVNRDLGFFDIEFNTSQSQVYFYIKNKLIVGVLVAEAKTTGHKLLTTSQDQVDLCSEESYSIKCGVSRIWVTQNQRNKGIATHLMNCLKRNFMYGSILKNEDVAFSSPTELGKIFGKSYFKTPNFLIYFV